MGKRKEIATKGEALEKDGESEQTASMGSYFVCHTQLVADMLLTSF